PSGNASKTEPRSLPSGDAPHYHRLQSNLGSQAMFHAASNPTLNRRRLLAGAAASTALLAAPAIVRAQGGPLKVGVLLPRSGFEASIGQDCYRGVEIAPPILKSKGLPELTIMNGDTESNVD